MREERVGFAMCGSFCTHEKALNALRELTAQYETVLPILSETAAASFPSATQAMPPWKIGYSIPSSEQIFDSII